jgi:hypothetical protein
VKWVFGLFVFVPLVLFVVLNLWISDQQVDPEDYPAIAALEDTLRPRGAVEDAVVRYEAVMRRVADELAARQPGLTWQWDRQVSSSKCGGDFEDTSAVQLRTRRLVASNETIWVTAQLASHGLSQL